MCLLTNQINPNIADKSIVCYKIFYIKNNTLRSYYKHFLYKLDKLYKSNLVKEKATFETESFNFMINVGIHSFTNTFQPEEIISHSDDKSVLVECIIPQGSEYYFGIFPTYPNKMRLIYPRFYQSYASNQIILNKICV